MERNQVERDALEAGSRNSEPVASRRALGAFVPVEVAADARDASTGGPSTELLKGIHLKVRAELGRTRVQLKDALQIEAGSVVDLQKLVDDPVDLYVGDLLVARGEVLVLNDTFCIRITEVFSHTGGEEES